MARKALDDLLDTRKMAQDLTTSQEEVVKLEKEQVDSEEAGKPQVESKTDQGLPANTSDSPGNTNDIHASCKRDRKELIESFGKLCRDESTKVVAKNEKLEATNKKLHDQVLELESRFAEADEHLEKMRREVRAKAQEVETVTSIREELHALRSIHDDLLVEIQQRDEDAKKSNEQHQAERQDAGTHISGLATEIQKQNKHIENIEIQLGTARDDTKRITAQLDYKKMIVASLNEVNDLVRADLQDEQRKCKALVIERDELEVQLAKTYQDLQETKENEVDVRREHEASRHEFNLAVSEAMQEQTSLRRDVDELTSQVVVKHDASRNPRIKTLERDNEVLKSQNAFLKSQAAESQVEKPVSADSPRPNNHRSISMASHTSLADELGSDDDQFDGTFPDDEEPIKEQVILEMTGIHRISIAPHEVARPQLTVSIGEGVATTPCVRQDSPLERSPVNSVPNVEPAHLVLPKLNMYNDTIADFAPSQPANPVSNFFGKTVECSSPIAPTSATLAVSQIIDVDCEPIETDTTGELQLLQIHVEETSKHPPVELELRPTPAPQQLRMHLFKKSVIQVDPESGSVCVTNPHEDRLKLNILKRRAELDAAGAMSTDETDLPLYGSWEEIPSMPKCLRKPCAASSLRRRSPIDPFARSSKLLDSHDLEKSTASWPIKDEKVDEVSVSSDTGVAPTASNLTTSVDIPLILAAESPLIVSTTYEKGSDASAHVLVVVFVLFLGSNSVPLPPVFIFLIGILSALHHLIPTQSNIVSTTSRKRLDPKVHYLLHTMMLSLAFFCWRFWNQLHAWEQVNGVGFGEGYGDAFDDSGPYGNGYPLLSMLPLNWMSADSHLPAKAVEVITSAVSAFEVLMRLGPTPSF